MLKYLIEVIAFQALFLAVYQFWLRKETFFNVNRVYLISTALLAFALPFMEFEIFQNQLPIAQNIYFLPEVVVSAENQNVAVDPVQQETDWSIYLLLYAAGVFFSTGMLFRKYQEVQRYFRFRQKADHRIINIPNSDAAFTFMGTIFLGNNISPEAKEHILAHEEVHLKQHHGLDLFLFEMLRVVFWFNPLVYIYQNKVAELHEFIADAQATKKTEKKSYYNQLLNTAFGTHEISFINTFFNHSLIKKRILMLQTQSKKKAKWKYLIVVPLIAGILTYVGCTDENEVAPNNTALTLEEQLADLQATIDAKESLTEEERNQLGRIAMAGMKGSKRFKIDTQGKVIEVTEWEESNNQKLDETVIVGYGSPDDKIIEVSEFNINDQELNDIPFAVIEEVPVFPGCESYGQKAKKECMSNLVSQFVNKNFNTNLGKELGLTGINRIYVRFKIDIQGNIVDVQSRASHPKLEEEAVRVISLLPKMTPGKQRGEAVNVLYSLPIVFQTN